MADNTDEDLTETFEKACSYVKAQANVLDSADLLFLYGRFKQVTEGPCSTVRPGFFNFQAKQKWDAWHSLGDMGPELAMEEYIDHVTNIDMDWEDKLASGAVKSRAGMGVAVSTPARPDDMADSEKTLFDWCKEGNVTQLLARLLPNTDVNSKDDMGMTLLHWACDRGHYDMVDTLLSHNALVNQQDDEGQTALHYACSCEHVDIVRLLLRHKADPAVKDVDSTLPRDCTANTEILKIIDNHSSQDASKA